MRRAIYPGSFDPVTNGHLDVIERAAKLFDEVLVAVAVNSQKQPLFTVEERLDLLAQTTAAHGGRVKLVRLEGLLVDYARTAGAGAIIRGLRAVSDFEFEFQMALMNRKLESSVETIFLMPKEEYTYLSSRIIKEIARLGGEVGSLCQVVSASPCNRNTRTPTNRCHENPPATDSRRRVALGRRGTRRRAPVADRRFGPRAGAAAVLARPGAVVGRSVGDGGIVAGLWNCAACGAWSRFPTMVHIPDLALQIERPTQETVDLTPEIREDIILALPAYPHCDWSGERECPGRVEAQGEEAAPAATAEGDSQPPSAWETLDQLKVPSK